MISPPKGFMSAENRDAAAESQRHQRKRNNQDNQQRNKGFSLQAKHPSEQPDGADAVSLDVGPTEKPRLVVIKNEEEIVRPSTSPDSPSSAHHNNNKPKEGMREMCADREFRQSA